MNEPPPMEGTTDELAFTSLLRTIVAIVFFTYVGQFLLNAAIAPLARSLGLAEWHIGFMLSLAALMVAVLSQWWGRASQSWGPKPVLVCALCLAFTAAILFALTTFLRTSALIPVTVAAVGIVLARGAFFGAAVAAVPPTGQALIAEHTPDERSRVKAMAAFGASFNVAAVVGALASGLLASWWLLAPVYATPVTVGVALVLTLVKLPRTDANQRRHIGRRISAFDARIRAYLAAGLGMFFAIGVVHITIGFVMQDRYDLDPQTAVLTTGLAMVAQAAGAMFSQLVLVPHLVWPPHPLLRVGLAILLFAVMLVAWSLPLWVTVAAVGLMGVGSGLASPGYNAGASLAVRAEEQGAVAGLLSATGGVTWIFAPIISTTLYGHWPTLALALSPIAASASLLLVLIHPTFQGSAGAQASRPHS